MRRLLLIAGVGLLSAVSGCHFMTGVCDCEPHGCGSIPTCAGCGAHAAPAGEYLPPAPAPVVKQETLKEMPKSPDK